MVELVPESIAHSLLEIVLRKRGEGNTALHCDHNDPVWFNMDYDGTFATTWDHIDGKDVHSCGTIPTVMVFFFDVESILFVEWICPTINAKNHFFLFRTMHC